MIFRHHLLLFFAAAALCFSAFSAGCSSNGSKKFESMSRQDQMHALRGSPDQLSPERKKQLEDMGRAMAASHGGAPPAATH